MGFVRKQWNRVRERIPLTNLGVVVLSVAAIAYWGFGVPRADYVVQIVSVLVMALVVGAVVFVIIGTWRLHRALEQQLRAPKPDPIQFEARRGFGDGLVLPAFRSLPFLEFKWSWEAPERFFVTVDRSLRGLTEQIETPSRVQHEQVHRRFTIEDSFGLAQIVLHRTEERTVRVSPWMGSLDRAPLLRSLASGEDVPHPSGSPIGDRVDMRRYVPGDPLRLALWKVFARTRQLMVRTPERSIAPAVRVLAYFVAAEDDEPAAAAAWFAVHAGLLGEDWIFAADGAQQEATTTEQALETILHARDAQNEETGHAARLEAFLSRHASEGPARVIVFAPASSGVWLTRVTAAIQKHGLPTHVLIACDGIHERDPVRRLDRVLKVEEERSPTLEFYATPTDLTSTAQTLVRAGADVSAFERPQGRPLSLGVPQRSQTYGSAA